MQDITDIITHAGPAHRDDFLAVAVALATFPHARVWRASQIYRGELEDPEILVLDIGGSLDPAAGNFDHHQDRGESRCALSLLLEDGLGYSREVLDAALPWLAVTDRHDLTGPVATAESLGVSSEVYASLASPVERALIGAFSSYTNKVPRWLMDALRRIGADILRAIKEEVEIRSPEAKAEVDTATSVDEATGLRILDLRGKKLPLPKAVKIVERHGLDQPHIIIADNPRGGVSITRNSAVDTDTADFRKVSGMAGVTFAHANGFMAAVTEEADVMAIIRAAARQ